MLFHALCKNIVVGKFKRCCAESLNSGHTTSSSTNKPATNGALRSNEDLQFMKRDHSVATLLDLLADSSVGLDALTTHVAIFGVLQQAHASATTGDEFGIFFLRGFIKLLSQRTPDKFWIVKITNILTERLQDQCERVQSQIQSLDEEAVSIYHRSTTYASQLANNVKPAAQNPNYDSDVRQHRVNNGKKRKSTADYQGSHQPKASNPKAAESSVAIPPSDRRKQGEIIPANLMIPNKFYQRVPGTNGFVACPAESGNHSNFESSSQHNLAKDAIPPSRPEHHLYKSTNPDAKDEVIASIRGDIKNYSEPGEDLDWTKIADPRERKRLQGVIGGRKYKERMLAAKGRSGSGGKYPGASGKGSSISKGYGKRSSQGAA